MAFPTFTISCGLFFFFFTLKISSFASDPPEQLYRISYLSTRKVVSVENLTGLFPSTWVTLVTCGDTGQSQPGIAAASRRGPARASPATRAAPTRCPQATAGAKRRVSAHSLRTLTVTGRHEGTARTEQARGSRRCRCCLLALPSLAYAKAEARMPRRSHHWPARGVRVPPGPRSQPQPYLYVAIVLSGDEGDVHREEVAWLPSYAELQAAAPVFGINHRQAPLEEIPPAVVAILTINLPNHWGADTRPRARNMTAEETLTQSGSWTGVGRNQQGLGQHLLALPKEECHSRQGDGDDDIVQLEVVLLQLILDVHVTAAPAF